MSRKAISLPVEDVRKAVECTDSALAASIHLGVTYTSFIRYAKKYGLYEPNQGGKGRAKPSKLRVPTENLLVNGKAVGSAHLKKRLLAEGIKKNECEECGQPPEHNGKPLVLQLDHVDGDALNNLLENLRILCPNCHTQTPTFCRGQYSNGRKRLSVCGEIGSTHQV